MKPLSTVSLEGNEYEASKISAKSAESHLGRASAIVVAGLGRPTMSDKNNYPRLRAMGEWGGHLANVLTFLTTNWVVSLSALFGIATGLNDWLRALVVQPAVYVSAAAFLIMLWTIIGLTVLVDRRRPRKVQTHLDYRYGLTFEGAAPQFIPADSGVPQAGCLAIGVQMRNFSPGPIHYRIEASDVRLGNRAVPKYKANSVTGYMARGSGRTSTTGLFESKEIKEFYGAGLVEGTADFSYTYGPPDGPPIRRLKISLEISIHLPKDGVLKSELPHKLGFNCNILSEEDEPI
jgi:hypothetical protein